MTHKRSTASRITRLIAAASPLFLISSVFATDFTWTGSVDGDWSNSANWTGGTLPSVDPGGEISGSGNTIIIQNGSNLPSTNVPDVNHGGYGGGTPRFDIEDGAALTVQFGPTSQSNYNGPVGDGTIVTVGAGASLTWTSATGSLYLMRDGNGTQTFDINGGAMTFDLNRLDLGFNNDRFVVFNVDAGTLNFTGTQLFGSNNAEAQGTATGNLASHVNLSNGSVFYAPNASFTGNFFFTDGAADQANTVFDLDANSQLTAKFGGILPNIAAVEAQEGNLFVSSTQGDSALVYTDNLDNTFTVSAPTSTTPLPSGDPIAAPGGIGFNAYAFMGTVGTEGNHAELQIDNADGPIVLMSPDQTLFSLGSTGQDGLFSIQHPDRSTEKVLQLTVPAVGTGTLYLDGDLIITGTIQLTPAGDLEMGDYQ